ncbi:MAG: site-specific integrase [Clostridia bacterium]|nr:site-specific integrase [Clostridia bacterium]
MSDCRRDNKGRKLRSGESQRADGRYVFKYYDAASQPHFVYSWRLMKSDPTPEGKSLDLSLREKEKKIQQDMLLGLLPYGANMTVIELVERYIAQKKGVRENTRVNYRFVLNILRKEEFGKQIVDKVRISDAKLWLIKLQEDGRGYSTIHAIRGIVRPAFQMAVDDDLIRKNPFSFQLATVVVNDSVTREAITRKQERTFLEFVRTDKHFSQYYDGIFLLFKTGLRISELCGLTLRNVNLEERKFTVDHQLQRSRTMSYYIEEPKTDSGKRTIPMTDDVHACFKRILENRKAPRIEPMVDGYVGFLFLDKNEKPSVALHWEHYFKRIVEKYNGIYKTPLPEITPHVCRHTYCSNMAKSGMNPKTLQYLMGHADISVTLNTYTHVAYEDIQEEVLKVVKPR